MRRLAVAATVLVLALAGCATPPGSSDPTGTPPAATPSATPTPTPTPEALECGATDEGQSLVWPDVPASEQVRVAGEHRPNLDSLVLTTEGIGPYPLGTTFPTSSPCTDPIVRNLTRCADTRPGDPAEWGTAYQLWRAEPGIPEGGFWWEPFGVNVDDSGRLSLIQVAYGLDAIATDRGIRMGATETEVAAAYPDAETAVPWDGVRVFTIRGELGSLHIGVADEGGGARIVVSMLLFDDPGLRPTILYATDGTYALECQYA